MTIPPLAIIKAYNENKENQLPREMAMQEAGNVHNVYKDHKEKKKAPSSGIMVSRRIFEQVQEKHGNYNSRKLTEKSVKPQQNELPDFPQKTSKRERENDSQAEALPEKKLRISHINGIDSLPQEDLENVFCFLKVRDLAYIATVSKMFRALSKKPKVVAAIVDRRKININPFDLPDVIRKTKAHLKNFSLPDFFLTYVRNTSPEFFLRKIYLWKTLSHCSNLERIDLSGVNLSYNDNDKYLLSTIIKMGTQAGSLLSYVRIGPSAKFKKQGKIGDLAWPALTELVCEKIEAKQIDFVTQWISQAKKLTVLRLLNSTISDKEVNTLAPHCSALQSLEITESKLNYGVIAIAQKCTNLQALILTGNRIGTFAFEGFADKCSSLTALKFLDLSKTGKGFEFSAIAESAAKLTALESLKISLDKSCAIDLMQDYRAQTSLTSLTILSSTINLDFSQKVSSLFPNLKKLDASHNYFESQYIQQIAANLTGKFVHLESLNLNHVCLLEDDFLPLLKPGMTSLTELNIDGNQFRNSFYESLPTYFPNLAYLSLRKKVNAYRPDHHTIYKSQYPQLSGLVNQFQYLVKCRPFHSEEQGEFEYITTNTYTGSQPKFW